jgi:L-lactate dehydrogenase
MTARVPAVGIVGAGAVGQAIAGALVVSGLCDRLLLASRTVEQAKALADDLDDMRSALGSPTRPSAADVRDLRTCAAVVIAVRARFKNTRSTDVRMGGAQANAPLIRVLAGQLADYPGTVLMVTNPVDLLTRLFAEVSGCARVFGIGSGLDTARYRLTLARLLDVPVAAVAGHVIGEHGEAAVVCASSTTVNGLPAPVPLQQVRDELIARPKRINDGIGRTRWGPAGAVTSALRLACGVEDGTTELSVPQWPGGEWVGTPVRFVGGQPALFLPPLDVAEGRRLEAAQTKLRVAYQAVRGIPSQPFPPERTHS